MDNVVKLKEEVDLVIEKMNKLCEKMIIEENQGDEIKEMKVNELLYDFDAFYFASASSQVYAGWFSDVNGMQRLLEDVLSIAVTEAICERFFPHMFDDNEESICDKPLWKNCS